MIKTVIRAVIFYTTFLFKRFENYTNSYSGNYGMLVVCDIPAIVQIF